MLYDIDLVYQIADKSHFIQLWNSLCHEDDRIEYIDDLDLLYAAKISRGESIEIDSIIMKGNQKEYVITFAFDESIDLENQIRDFDRYESQRMNRNIIHLLIDTTDPIIH